MEFKGQGIQCQTDNTQIVTLTMDLQNESVNKFNALMLKEFAQVIDTIAQQPEIKGLIITSAKESLLVGADVTEFLSYFKQSDAQLSQWLTTVNTMFCQLEDLPFPSVTTINGFCLGGGMEMALSTVFRIATAEAKIGLPETKLGIYPGWGGTVRLPRLIGSDNAIEWIASGKSYNAEAALKVGVIDAIVAPERKLEAAKVLINQAHDGIINWQSRVLTKKHPLRLNPVEAGMVFEVAKAFVGAQAGPNYPAPLAAVKCIKKAATMSRDDALKVEQAGFIKMAKTPQAKALVNIFLGDQQIKKQAKKWAKESPDILATAVIGAGIMGGGIAYQTASKKIRIHMKDLNESMLNIGLQEAGKLLNKLISLGRLNAPEMAVIMARIRATLSYHDFSEADVVVEAVVENLKVKQTVLAEVESFLKDGAILTSNTSTISINKLAESLKKPENFCGMHFFNPVHRMPLVEIIRGEKTNDQAIASTVNYALKMGKTPIVVNDCPGFFVNRVLFPYFYGFAQLINDGVNYLQIDRAMEDFGWPMGPSYLLDVVGIDTAYHGSAVMSQAFPERMKQSQSIIDVLYKKERLGQKNGSGMYHYGVDKKGKPKKIIDPALDALIKDSLKTSHLEISDEDIVLRMMLPMIFESARCLQENIVANPVDADMAVVYGLGFPPFRGGIFQYADELGAAHMITQAKVLQSLGGIYKVPDNIQQLADKQHTFHRT